MALLRQKLARMPQDTLWIIQPENRRYLSGFKAKDGQLNESSGSLLITRKIALLFTDSRYAVEAEREAADFRVIALEKGLLESLPGVLSDHHTSCLGFEETHLTLESYQKLKKALKGLVSPPRLRAVKGLVETMREVKDREEIETMERCSQIMTEILGETISRLRAGRTERDIAWEMEGMVRESGAEGPAFPFIVASGPNSALPHAVPTERKIREREPITFDVGMSVNGYCCDMTRTIFLGGPTPRFKKIYRTVRQAQVLALGRIRPGVESTFVDAGAREFIRDAGFGDYFGHSLGHGVGLATHERPRLGPDKPVLLKEGMVVTVEPGIYIPGKGGVRLEHMAGHQETSISSFQ